MDFPEAPTTPGGYLKAQRSIESTPPPGLHRLNMAILGTSTLDLLRPYLVVEGARRGFLLNVHFAPFNQLEQQALDPGSPLYGFAPDVVAILARLEDLAPELARGAPDLPPSEVSRQMEDLTARCRNLVGAIRRNSPACIFLSNFIPPLHRPAGLADALAAYPTATLFGEAGRRVAAVCRDVAGAFVFDWARLAEGMGLRNWVDLKLWYLGRVPVGADAQRELSVWLMRHIRAALRPPCKCLVLDLDNTVWGGVLGEAGGGGIDLGEDYPGRAYKDFQRWVLTLRSRGVLLAVASKNDSAEVMEVLRRHPDVLLRPDHFSAFQIHWGDKADSLRAIARDLNIGLDALAYFDDSPVERAWIRSHLPEVTVIDVPDLPLGFIGALEDSGAFDQLVISNEDRNRPEFYRAESERRKIQGASPTLEEFLGRLEIRATTGLVNEETLPRVCQLLGRTNRFILTARRYSAAELDELIRAGALALWLRGADRFGDNGLVGAAIAVPGEAGCWRIDNLLLSCRVIGRGFESALLEAVSRLVRQRGGNLLIGEYDPSARNGVASALYPSHGFERADGDGRFWHWDLSRGDPPVPAYVRLQFENGPIA